MNFNRIFFTASTFALSAATLAAVTPEEYYQQGCDFYQKGNMVEARKAFEASAMGGNAMSQVCYANFLKKEGKLKDAVKWYEKAAKQNQEAAQCSLGTCYLYGVGVAQDQEKAIKWLKKAVKNGDLTAEERLKDLGIL